MTKIGYNKNKAVMGRGTPLQSGIEVPWKNRNFCAVQTVQKDFLTEGNIAQRASGDFARHLLANFPSYFTKMLVNTSSIHSAFCFI